LLSSTGQARLDVENIEVISIVGEYGSLQDILFSHGGSPKFYMEVPTRWFAGLTEGSIFFSLEEGIHKRSDEYLKVQSSGNVNAYSMKEDGSIDPRANGDEPLNIQTGVFTTLHVTR